MNNKSRKISITFILVHLFLISFSQVKVGGLVLDTDGTPVPYAIISEINKQGEVFIADSLGRFALNKKADSLYLYIECIGYKSQERIIDTIDSGEVIITLEIDPTTLNEVVVSAHRRNIKIETDRLVYDMSSNPLKDDNTLEALKFVPLVSSNGESFSIIGKDYTDIYINGRKKEYERRCFNCLLKDSAGRQD